MRALLSRRVGGPELLEMAEIAAPVPGPDQLLVRVAAVSLNYPDALIIEDKYQFKPPRPFAPGGELAGTVVAVGANVHDIAVGTRICALTACNALAQMAVVDRWRTLVIPDEMPFDIASTIVMTYGTNMHGLADRGALKPGDTMLVLGAGGGIGLAAIELGKALGARVVGAVSSPEKAAAAQAAGADAVVVYPPGPLNKAGSKALADRFKAACPGGYDVVYDPVGGPYAEPALRAVGWEGRYVVVGFAGGIPTIPLNLPLLKACSVVGVSWGRWADRNRAAFHAQMATLFAWWREGKVRPLISQRYTFEQAPEAIARLSGRSVVGKLVVLLDESSPGGSGKVDMADVRANVRDPLTGSLLGPGKPFELEEVVVAGHLQQMFKDRPRDLSSLYRGAVRFGARPLVVHTDRTLSYDAVFARAASLAAVMHDSFGVKQGTVVGLAAANSAEFLIALVAITAAGGIAALINSRGVAEEMLHAIEVAGCQLVVLDAERAASLEAKAPDPTWRRIVAGADEAMLRAGDMSFEDAIGDPSAVFAPVPMTPDDGAMILFTSGTTGYPKAALLTHGGIAHAVALSAYNGALQDMRYEHETGQVLAEHQRAATSPAVILPPMFHLSGMVPAIRALGLGATIHIMSKWNVDIAFDTMAATGMSRLSFVPAMLWDILRSPRATPQVLAQIRFMVNGGAPLNPDLVAEIRARMPHVLLCNAYGQTENAGWATTICGQDYLDNPSSCGWAIPTVHMAIRRDDRSEADIGEPGEIWTSSPGTMAGYVGDPQATRDAIVDGWLATGDIGYVDAKGLFHVVDRKKNMVISGGENIYCAEVERVLSLHPDVLECVTYGIADERLGERLVAEIHAVPGTSLDAETIKAHCRAHLAIYKVPREVRFVAAPLHRTGSGKIERRRAQA